MSEMYDNVIQYIKDMLMNTDSFTMNITVCMIVFIVLISFWGMHLLPESKK